MSFPVTTKQVLSRNVQSYAIIHVIQGEITVGGKTVDVVISHFGTHLFLCLSHYHKLGSLVSKQCCLLLQLPWLPYVDPCYQGDILKQ